VATFTERLRIVLDLQAEKLETGLKKIRDSVKEADGFVGKMTAGVKGASEAFFGSPAALAGAASVGAAALAKVTSEASDLGVEIGKLSDATGLSTEQASRWIEVAKDMGIGSDTLAGLLEKMVRNIGSSPDKFKELGIFIQHAADGTVDMNATMLLAVDRINAIQDPTKRAATEASLFGRSWASASELLKMSSSDIKKRLDEVGSAKVYDSQQVADSRAFRDALQDLKNTGEDLAIEIGKDLLPAITLVAKGAVIAAKGVKGFVDVAAEVGGGGRGDVRDSLKQAEDLFKKYGDQVWKSDYAVKNHIGSLMDWSTANAFSVKLSVEDLTKSVEAQRSKMLDHVAAVAEVRQGTYNWTQAQDDARAASQKLTDEAKAQEQATKDLDAATKNYADSVERLYKDELDRLGLKEQITTMLSDWKTGHDKNIDAAKTLAEKQALLSTGTLDSKASIEAQIATLTVLETTTKKGSPLWKAIEDHKQGLKEAADQAERIQAAEAGLNAQAANAAAGGGVPAFGSPVTVPVGGRGPEGAGYSVYNVNVTVSDPSPIAVINAITAWERRNGTAWRS